MTFEWDDHKNNKNLLKHGIDFETAVTVFLDLDRIEYYDVVHSDEEPRFITIGIAGNGRTILTVVYTERRERIRIISARKATRKERERYHEGQI